MSYVSTIVLANPVVDGLRARVAAVAKVKLAEEGVEVIVWSPLIAGFRLLILIVSPTEKPCDTSV
jgi:hypothetical protein